MLVCAQGHSLGGSLSTILTLLLLHRGILHARHVAPAYTFGAPAVFCGGECGAVWPLQQQQQEVGQQQQQQRVEVGCASGSRALGATAGNSWDATASRGQGLLPRLGLTDNHFVNIIMHRCVIACAHASTCSLLIVNISMCTCVCVHACTCTCILLECSRESVHGFVQDGVGHMGCYPHVAPRASQSNSCLVRGKSVQSSRTHT